MDTNISSLLEAVSLWQLHFLFILPTTFLLSFKA